ncbi:MAG: S9 family peptidase [Bacteroidota bacterium]
MKVAFSIILALHVSTVMAQQNLTPEKLWQLQRVSGLGVSKDGMQVAYKVTTPSATENKSSSKIFAVPIAGGQSKEVDQAEAIIGNSKISPDGKYIISSSQVKIDKVFGSDFYPDLDKSNVQIYDQLNYRHWDEWEDGKYGHVMIAPLIDGKAGDQKDIMPGEPFDCPTKPYGDETDYTWSPDSKKVVYVCKKKSGVAYAISTNTDIYSYDVETGKTTNISEANKGYDVSPQFNNKGKLAWMQMRRDGYEADKQDLVVWDGKAIVNLTGFRDDIHVEGFKWSNTDNRLFFWAPINGTLQLFDLAYKGLAKIASPIRQITKGDFDISGIVGQSGNYLVVTRTDMNHATELFKVDLSNGSMEQLSHVNDAEYANINMVKTERRFVKTADNQQMLVWVVYPPGFDPKKKYPALLYCQGGPQSPLTQFYSFRWNLQLMASQGYIIVAPNRRGMPGHGTKWNEDISKDHGGKAISDYLAAIDNVSKETFVDKSRLGCVGASYGGYSAFYLAAFHKNRFKTFIAHDGIFDFRSMYGSTEEIWFPDWDYGGAYWDTANAAAQKSYKLFSPSNFVTKWNRPILILHGGKDYRVPAEQGMQAFQAAQLRGLKSRFVYLPDENHWVLTAQNALVWQREFFRWLDETL